MAQAASRRNHIIDMLVRAMQRGNVRADSGLAGSAWRYEDQDFDIRARSCPAIPERILEVLKAHLFESLQRERAGLGINLKSMANMQRETALIVRVPHFPTSARFAHHLEALTGATPPQAAWAIVSDGGGAYLSVPKSAAVFIPDDQANTGASMTGTSAWTMRNPWDSDAASALLTVLLMQRALPRTRWSAWTPAAAEMDVEAMAAHLGVGRSTLYGVIGEFAKGGWMSSARGRLPTLTDIPGIVNWYFDHRKHSREKRVAVVPLYSSAWTSPEDIMHWLKTKVGTGSITWAIAGWRACALHDLGVLADHRAKPVEIVVREPVSSVLREWQLKEQPENGGHSLHLFSTSMPITTFACTGMPIAALPVVDPWQAALDVIGDPQRGMEQATAIADTLWLGTA